MRMRLLSFLILPMTLAHAMNKDEPKKEEPKQAPNTSAIIKKFKDVDNAEDDWIESDDATDALSPRRLVRFQSGNQTQESQIPHLANLVQSLKENPDAFAFDSDEMPEIIARLEGKPGKK